MLHHIIGPKFEKVNFFLGFFSPSYLDFFSEKKIHICKFGFFFSEQKNKFEGEKKPRKKFSFFKFGFSHMDGPNISLFDTSTY